MCCSDVSKFRTKFLLLEMSVDAGEDEEKEWDKMKQREGKEELRRLDRNKRSAE